MCTAVGVSAVVRVQLEVSRSLQKRLLVFSVLDLNLAVRQRSAANRLAALHAAGAPPYFHLFFCRRQQHLCKLYGIIILKVEGVRVAL